MRPAQTAGLSTGNGRSDKRTVLMIAMHYPPFRRGSGYLRTLKFCEHLPELGWEPIVLTVRPSAYGAVDSSPDGAAPPGLVYRSFALDAARSLSIRGKYPGIFALPDRWVSWLPHAVWQGLQIVRHHQPDVIVSTYPVATAHLIGLIISRVTGIPWVADFRDPIIDDHYPRDRMVRWARARLEVATLKRCDAATFTSHSARATYAKRFSNRTGAELVTILNGYDEGDFERAATLAPLRRVDSRLTLLHSGVLYRDVRDPEPFFAALSRLKSASPELSVRLRVILRASGPEHHHRCLIDKYSIGDVVELLPAVSYTEALAEMCAADCLLLFQGREANSQVPAKLFEYMRSGRPILALVDKDGDTARILGDNNCGYIVPINSVDAIERALQAYVSAPEAAASWSATRAVASSFSRYASAKDMADLLDGIAERKSPRISR